MGFREADQQQTKRGAESRLVRALELHANPHADAFIPT